MMDIGMKLQASIYANASDITPNPDNISALIEMFRDMEFIPSTFNEINIQTGAPLTRIKLQSLNKEWMINIGTQRIDITKNPTNAHGTNIGAPEDFTESSIQMFRRLLERYRKNVTRLVYIEQFLWSEKSGEDLSEIYNKLFVPITFYEANPPFEWNWRAASNTSFDISGNETQTHAITAYDRISGVMREEASLREFDRIKVTFDINTKPNTDYRFEIQDIESFFGQALPLRETLLAQTTEVIDG